ncbi:MAG: CvpA family protein [Odoribacteraceae bacterium]|jgi:membrane protein required for colicin V production|nr:CvpA family protein [Odoribacteraceae bacterium]
MNYVDIILLVPLLYGAFRGLSRGLIVEVFTLIALVAGIYFSLRWSGSFEGILQEFVAIPAAYAYHVAFALIFLLIVIAAHLLGKLLTKIAGWVALGLLNRVAGMLFGALKMAIIVCAILFLLDAIDKRYDIISTDAREESLLYDHLVNFANKIYQIVIHKH